MGTTVLNPGAFSVAGLHVYAHCQRDKPGGVTVLVINANRTAAQSLDVPMAAERYTITAGNLLSKQVQLNGNELSLGAGRPAANDGNTDTIREPCIRTRKHHLSCAAKREQFCLPVRSSMTAGY